MSPAPATLHRPGLCGGHSSDGRAPGCGPGCHGFESRWSPHPPLTQDLRMHLSLQGRRALITGGSKGLGLAMGRAFAEAGARVVLVARGESALRQAAESIPGSVPVQADIATAG